MSAFEELGLNENLIKAVEDMDWYLPKPVQQDAIPLILGGGDVMCAAETGAGKTGAFSLPILQVTWETLHDKMNPEKGKTALKHCSINKEDVTVGLFKVAENGLACQVKDPTEWGGGRANFGVTSGKWFYEVRVTDEGLCRVGWATRGANLVLGTDRQGFAYGGTGKRAFNNQFDDWGEKFGKGDVITCMCDRAAREISFMKNGKSLGKAFPIPQAMQESGEALFPALCSKSATIDVNFGRGGAVWSVQPEGFEPMENAPRDLQERLYGEFQLLSQQKKSGDGHFPTCVIIEPTIELGQQVVDELYKFTKFLEQPAIKVCSMVGKRDTRDIERELRAGVDICVSTPGRMEQFMRGDVLRLKHCRFIVMDEADRLGQDNLKLCLSLYRKIREQCKERVQVCMFSATLHDDAITKLHHEICPDASWVDLKGRDYVPDTVHHGVVYADPERDEAKWTSPGCGECPTDGVHRRDFRQGGPQMGDPMKNHRWSEGVKRLKPEILLKVIDANKMEQCLIFCRTRDDCDNVSTFLNMRGGGRAFQGKVEKGKENPYSNVVLHSGRPPRERAENLSMFKEGDVRFLICTDVAARGLDIKQLPYVINLTLPDKAEDYIHRIGRTGRSDRMGLAVSIASRRHKEKVWYHSNCNRGFRSDGSVCQDTRLTQDGGCCIWYDESQLVKDIEARCGEKLEEMGRDFRFQSKKADQISVEYGKSREEARANLSDHIISIQSELSDLLALEKQSQRNYLLNTTGVIEILAGRAPAGTGGGGGRGRGRGRGGGRGAAPEAGAGRGVVADAGRGAGGGRGRGRGGEEAPAAEAAPDVGGRGRGRGGVDAPPETSGRGAAPPLPEMPAPDMPAPQGVEPTVKTFRGRGRGM